MAELQGLSGIEGLSDTFINFVRMMRLWMRDFPQLNSLIRGEESSDRFIVWAVLDFLSDFQQTPPPLGSFTLDNILELGYTNLARYGTALALLESVGLLQTRNQLNFSDGGINVGISDKTPLLQSWINMFRQKYEQDKLKIKVSMNIQQIIGESGVHSEYFFINGFYGSLFQ